jgi:hypothetical protein
MKRPLTIALTYLGLVVALLFMVGIFLPLLLDQINDLTNFIAAAAQAPKGPTEYIKGIAQQSGLGGVFERFSDQLADLRKQLGELLRNVLLSTGGIAVSAAGFVAALANLLEWGRRIYLAAGLPSLSVRDTSAWVNLIAIIIAVVVTYFVSLSIRTQKKTRQEEMRALARGSGEGSLGIVNTPSSG